MNNYYKASLMSAALLMGMTQVNDGWANEEDFSDLPVVLTGARLNQNPELSIQPVTVITREMIDMSGARHVADLFRMVPGFTVGYKYGNQPTLITKGLTGEQNRRIQFRVDGRSVYLPALGGVFLGNLPVQITDIERIEVSRGPSSSVHGANALLAAIDIYTKAPLEDSKIRGWVRSGNNGIEDYTLQFSEELSDSLNVIGSIKQHRDDGLIDRFDTRDDESIWLKLDQRINPENNIEWQLGYSDSLYGAGGTSPTLDPERDLGQRRFFGQFNWTSTYSDTHDSNLIGFIEEFDLDHRINSSAPGFGPFQIDYSYTTERKSLEYYHNFHNAWGTFVAGGTALSESYKSKGRISDDVNNVVNNDVYQLFAQAEIDLADHHKLNAGLMAEHSDITSNIDISPQISYIYDINNAHFFRVGHSIGHRLPSGFENAGQTKYELDLLPMDLYTMKATGYQNGGLKSEEMDETSIGYTYVKPEGDLRFESVAYYSKVKNVIEFAYRAEPSQALTPFPNVVDYYNNPDEVLLKGLEFNLDWKPSNKWLVNASAAFTDVSGTGLGYYDYADSHPERILSLLVGYHATKNLTLSGFYHRVTQSEWSVNESIEGYEKLDLQAKYCRKLTVQDTGCIKVTAQNVLEDVYDARTDYGWDQMYFVTLEYRR
ncbi:TonB-dependent receptor plug domain-containing protein [Neptuniibacter sp. QD37_11]|uniref:TonB-dependent receptor plug domain-containing protein n=1 Tax=Neptuniibacter sp. QD37_11 TaxID=3398209 RepID=UPI0039F48DBE